VEKDPEEVITLFGKGRCLKHLGGGKGRLLRFDYLRRTTKILRRRGGAEGREKKTSTRNLPNEKGQKTVNGDCRKKEGAGEREASMSCEKPPLWGNEPRDGAASYRESPGGKKYFKEWASLAAGNQKGARGGKRK